MEKNSKLLVILNDVVRKNLSGFLINKPKFGSKSFTISDNDNQLKSKLNDLVYGLDYILIDKNIKMDNLTDVFIDIDKRIGECSDMYNELVEIRDEITNQLEHFVEFIISDEMNELKIEDTLSKYRVYELDGKYMLASAGVKLPAKIEKLLLNCMENDEPYVFGNEPGKGYFIANKDGVVYE